jgi:hypothetical protein
MWIQLNTDNDELVPWLAKVLMRSKGFRIAQTADTFLMAEDVIEALKAAAAADDDRLPIWEAR